MSMGVYDSQSQFFKHIVLLIVRVEMFVFVAFGYYGMHNAHSTLARLINFLGATRRRIIVICNNFLVETHEFFCKLIELPL